jgi:transposase-like protein
MSSDCSRGMLHQCAPPCVATIVIAFPAEIIGSCVGLCFRFALSFRDTKEMLAMRAVFLQQ